MNRHPSFICTLSLLLLLISSAVYAQTVQYSEADAFVRGGTYQGANYGAATDLRVKYGGADKTWERMAFLRFPLTGVTASTLTSAVITLRIQQSAAAVFPFSVAGVSNSWQESTITWSTKPATGAIIASPSVAPGQTTLVVNVTAYVKQALQQGSTKASFVLQKASGSTTDQIILWSRESGTTNAPSLTLRTSATTATCSPSCQNGGVCNNGVCQCNTGYTGSYCQTSTATTDSRVTTYSWADQFTKKAYRMEVSVPECTKYTSRAAPIKISFYPGDALATATLMYQFSSKCDVSNCDCSEPIQNVARLQDGMLFTANITYPGSTQTALSILTLYKASSWTARHQYPEDALPHKFMTTNIGCGTGSAGPCNPATCWISLGVHGCN